MQSLDHSEIDRWIDCNRLSTLEARVSEREITHHVDLYHIMMIVTRSTHNNDNVKVSKALRQIMRHNFLFNVTSSRSGN